MKQEIIASKFIRKAVNDVFTRLYNQIEEVNPDNNKPLLNSKTIEKLQTLKPIIDAINAGEKITTKQQINALHCIHISLAMTAKLIRGCFRFIKRLFSESSL